MFQTKQNFLPKYNSFLKIPVFVYTTVIIHFAKRKYCINNKNVMRSIYQVQIGLIADHVLETHV